MAQGVKGTRLVTTTKDTLRRLSADLVEAGLQKHSKGFAREVFLELAELVRHYGKKMNGMPEFSDDLLEDSFHLGMAALRVQARGGDVRSANKLVDVYQANKPQQVEHTFKTAEETEAAGIAIFLRRGYSEEEARARFEELVLGSEAMSLPEPDDENEGETE